MNDPHYELTRNFFLCFHFKRETLLLSWAASLGFFRFELTRLLYFHLQTCAEAYDLLLSGDFGASGSDSAESYRQVCQKFFPYATKFNLNSKDTSETPEDTIEDTTTHNNSTSNNNVENNSEKITNSSPVKAEINEPEP